jgi:hypothetical protein
VTHALKTEPVYFNQIVEGNKTFEVRKMDRPFLDGDELILQEWYPEQKIYTGKEWKGKITYILADERFCKKGYCVLGIQKNQE